LLLVGSRVSLTSEITGNVEYPFLPSWS